MYQKLLLKKKKKNEKMHSLDFFIEIASMLSTHNGFYWTQICHAVTTFVK